MAVILTALVVATFLSDVQASSRARRTRHPRRTGSDQCDHQWGDEWRQGESRDGGPTVLYVQGLGERAEDEVATHANAEVGDPVSPKVRGRADGGSAGAPTPALESPADALENLGVLRYRGVLSAEEFAMRKRGLLERM